MTVNMGRRCFEQLNLKRIFERKLDDFSCHRKLIFRGKYKVSIGETIVLSLIAVFGRANRVLVTKYTPFLCDPWVGHLV